MTSVPVLLYFYYLCFYVLCGGTGQAEVGAGPPEVRSGLGPWSAQEVGPGHFWRENYVYKAGLLCRSVSLLFELMERGALYHWMIKCYLLVDRVLINKGVILWYLSIVLEWASTSALRPDFTDLRKYLALTRRIVELKASYRVCWHPFSLYPAWKQLSFLAWLPESRPWLTKTSTDLYNIIIIIP